MSSPLRWFRRNQKVMMVFFGVGLMAIFGLGTAFMAINPADLGRTRDNPVIAKWKGGDIHKDDLLAMRYRHFDVIRFIEGLQEYAAAKKGDNFRPMAAPIRSIAQGGDFDPQMVDEQLIERFLLAKRAEEEGMVVSDGMVEDYLALLAGNEPVSRNEMVAINKQMNQTASIENVFRRLKVELAAEQMRQFTVAALPVFPNPTEAMEHYGRTTRRVGCEVVPISVDVSAVTEKPTSAEIKKIYDEGKYRFPDPVSNDPGFKVGRKVKVQYLLADLNTFLANEMNEITDKMVQEEYQRLVETQDPTVMEVVPSGLAPALMPEKIGDRPPVVPDDQGDDQAPKPDVGDESKDGADGDQENEDAGDGGANEGDPENKPAVGTDNVTSNEDQSAEGGNVNDSPADSNGSKQNDESDSTGNTSGGNDQTFALTKQQTFVSLIQEESQKGKGENEKAKENEETEQETGSSTPADSKQQEGSGSNEENDVEAQQKPPAEQGSGSEATEEDDSNQDQKTDESQAEPGQSGTGSKESTESGQGADPTSQTETEDAPPVMADEKEPEKRVRPLVDVADQIKRSMARQPATDAIKEAMRKAEAILGDYRYRYAKWEFAEETGDTDVEKPEPFDGAAVVEELKNMAPQGKYVLEFGETGLVGLDELEKEKVGSILVPQMYYDQGRPRQTLAPLARIIFGRYHDATLFDPAQENDFNSGSTYQYWISEKQDAYVPEIAEAEPEIIKYWQRQRAIEKAMEQAKSIADEINQAGVTLTQSEHSGKAVSTGDFSWFNTMSGRPTFSQPLGVVNAGNDFMEVVFGLKPNEAGVALNETKDTVYVVQMIKAPQSIEIAGEEYLKDQFFKFKQVPMDVQSVSRYFASEINFDWTEQFTDSMGLEFVDR